MDRLPALLIVGLAVTVLPSVAVGEAGDGPSEVVATLLGIEQTLLVEDQERYATLSLRRSEALTQVEVLHDSLDVAVSGREGSDPTRIERLMDQVERAELERDALLAAERVVVERITDRLKRMVLLDEEVARIQAEPREEEVEGLLSGQWDLVFMPIELRGTCKFQQSGALVNGTYRLEGGLSGSLQGTLVNRKVFLVRIDSKLGKTMELEGFLSGDGARIRGSWLNYELAGSEGSTGEWTARRRSPGS